MYKQDFFCEVLERVCNEMDIQSDMVLHSNREECVDARYIVIAILSERMNNRQIADVSGWSVQLVNKAKNAFEGRCVYRWGLRGIYLKLKGAQLGAT